ncbi:hypothetical protein EBS80_02885 [bacterium]|nr:hypothetical protein [bacterium]
MFPDLERERALEPLMKTFLNSPAMFARVQRILEQQATGKGTYCVCGVFVERAHFDTDGSRVYTYRVNAMNCPMHTGVAGSRWIAFRESDSFPFDAEKTELIGTAENRFDVATYGGGPPEHGHHRDRVTVYRDIERAFEDEALANREKFRPGPGRIDPTIEVTAENWMKFI